MVRLGSFEAIREVGSGGMGVVWEGRHVVTGAPVALKFLTSQHIRDARWIAIFHTEARAISRLDHPRVVRVYDVGTVPESATLDALPRGSPYIVMEWVPQSLSDVPRPLAWEPTRASLLEVLDALAHVHARRIVHRDIKPANVLGKLGRLRIADFGIARLDDREATDTISGVEESQLRSNAGEEAMARVCLLPCDAKAGRWDDLRENFAIASDKRGTLVDVELGLMATAAARFAENAGEHELAEQLHSFAQTHRVG